MSVPEINGVVSPKPPPNSWANDPSNHFAVWVIRLTSMGSFTIPKITEGINRSIYVFKNSDIKINEIPIRSNSMIELYPQKNTTLKNRGNNTKVLMLQGKPINESVVQYGPFVMNTRSEIEEAFHDYNKTGFGEWKWKTSDPVHGGYEGKFAKLISGKIDKPS